MKERKWYPWFVVGLLWVVALLNYMDRQMLSTMQMSIGETITPIKDPANFGRLMAIFLWIYGFMSPVSGAVADRINRKWLIVGSLGVWSAVTLMMGFCDTFDQIYWLRALMGVSEALYSCRTVAYRRLFHWVVTFFGDRHTYDRPLCGSGSWRFRRDGGSQLFMARDILYFWLSRYCICHNPYGFPPGETADRGRSGLNESYIRAGICV